MAMPSCYLGDFLLAYWAESVLLFPEMDKPALSFQGVYYVNVQTLFIVSFPFRVVGVGLALDFRMSFDWHVGCIREVVFLPILLPVEDPVLPFLGLEVFLRDPLVGFLWVSSFHPLSQSSIDGIVYVSEYICANHMLMILCPSSNDWIEHQDQSSSR